MEVVDPARPDPDVIRRAAELLRSGGLVAFPTETVYGLGANALDAGAVQRIFDAKGRPAYNPLIVHVPDAAHARELTTSWPLRAAELAARFWPGPLTLVLPKQSIVPDRVTAGLGTVAIRVPRHPVALALLREAGVPIAAPSANRFTRLSPTTGDHVVHGLESGVDLILDAGPTPVGIESTVVDLSGATPVLLRPGMISREMIERVIGPLGVAEQVDEEAARPAPGMTRKHYSPDARLMVFAEEDRTRMAQRVRDAVAQGETVGALLLRPLAETVQHVVIMPDEPAGYAARLYSVLHDLDTAGCGLVVVDAVPAGVEWAGVRDRLAHAAQPA